MILSPVLGKEFEKNQKQRQKMEEYLTSNGFDLESLKETLSLVTQLRSELEEQIRTSNCLEDKIFELQEKTRADHICDKCERNKIEVQFLDEIDKRLARLRLQVQQDRQNEAGFFKRLFSTTD